MNEKINKLKEELKQLEIEQIETESKEAKVLLKLVEGECFKVNDRYYRNAKLDHFLPKYHGVKRHYVVADCINLNEGTFYKQLVPKDGSVEIITKEEFDKQIDNLK